MTDSIPCAPQRLRGGVLVLAGCIVALGVGLVGVPATAAAPLAVQAAAGVVHVTSDVEIPTRSGHVLRGDLYRPVADGSPKNGLPTIVTYFPYVKDDDRRFEVTAMRQFAQAGYAGLLVDIAGTGASMGEFGFLSNREIADGHDVVEWAAAQPFSNGRVGMWGYSYPGITAARVAATRPPHLKAVVPASIFNDAYRDVVAPGGMTASQDAVLLPFIAGQAVARQRPGTDPAIAFEELLDSATSPGGPLTVAEAATHTFYDDYWKERALDGRIEDIEVPALLWGGWADVYPRGTLLNHAAIGSKHKRLVMGPWGHLAAVSGEPYELFLEESLTWFDTFLRQDPSPAQARAASGTRLFDVDWSREQDAYGGVWPGRFVEIPTGWPRTQSRTLALCADGDSKPEPAAPWPLQGELRPACAAPGSIPVVHAPADPSGGGSIAHDGFANPFANGIWDDKDQRLSMASTALLTEPLAVPTTLTGPMRVDLWATTTSTDADWVVRVVDVGPERTRVLAPGWLRATRRSEDPGRGYLWHTHDHDEPLSPGEPYQMRLEVWPTSYTVPAGHRLGLLVRTADTLKVTPGATPGISTILTGPQTPSALTVSVRTAGVGAPSGSPTAGGPGAAGPGRPDQGGRVTLPATGASSALGLLAATVLALTAALHRVTSTPAVAPAAPTAAPCLPRRAAARPRA